MTAADNKDNSKTKHTGISKWQQSSVKATQLRFQLSELLDNFTEEEKKDKRYTQLLETVDVIYDHVIGDYRKDKENKYKKEAEKYKNKSKLLSIRTLWITLIGASVAEIGKQLIINWKAVLQFITGLF